MGEEAKAGEEGENDAGASGLGVKGQSWVLVPVMGRAKVQEVSARHMVGSRRSVQAQESKGGGWIKKKAA